MGPIVVLWIFSLKGLTPNTQNVSMTFRSPAGIKVRDMLEYVPWKAEEHPWNTTDLETFRRLSMSTRVEAVQLLEEKRFDEAIRLANSVGHGIEGLGHIVCIK